MRIHKTGHVIADTVVEAFNNAPYAGDFDLGYGILRGMTGVYRNSDTWFCIDNGYWGAGHFDGNYRINFKGTQSQYTDELQKEHGLTLEPWQTGRDTILIVPPSEYVCEFFPNAEIETYKIVQKYRGEKFIVRHKFEAAPIDWKKIKGVVTFNSTLGVEALRLGIPVLSNIEHSMIGSYYKQKLMEKGLDYNFENVMNIDRNPLFNCMNSHQFTLEEIRRGNAWPIIKYYLSLSDGTQERQ